MQLKKYVVSLLAVALSTAAFALPAPANEDQTAEFMQQYTAQMEDLNKAFEQTLLPPLKRMLPVIKEIQANGGENITEKQEKDIANYADQMDAALDKIVNPLMAELSDDECNQIMKEQVVAMLQMQFMQKQITASDYEQAVNQVEQQTFTKQDYSDYLKSSAMGMALGHFIQANLLTEEEQVLINYLFQAEPEQ